MKNLCNACHLVSNWLFSEIADVCLFLASNRSSYVTGTAIEVTGQLSEYHPQYLFDEDYENKTTIHQVATMLAASKNASVPGHNHPANHRYC